MKSRYIIFFFLLLYLSCSNSNKPRGSSSNFLAYYNTFYTSEKSFHEALSIIKEDNDDDEISDQAVLLLNEAIENALIIEERFSETRYLDDAYYILGRSSYLIDRITASNYYFNRLINEFPKSDLYKESFIWIGYIVVLLPSLAVGARRLHDAGRSGWWQLLVFTIIGIILLIIWWATVGENKKNNHGYPIKLKR